MESKLKIVASVLLPLALYLSVFAKTAYAAEATLTIDYVPAVDSGTIITGHADLKNGNYSDYNVTLYLQVIRREGEKVWGPKPTLANPTVPLDEKGRFSLNFVSGGLDRIAEALYVYLVPKSFHPDESESRTVLAAAASASVYRSASGDIEGVASESYIQLDSKAQQKDYSRISINFSPYVDGQSPEKGSKISNAQIEAQLSWIKPYADTIRLFSVTGELAKVYPIAKEQGFRIIGGAWLDKSFNESQIYAELDALVEVANKGLLDVAVVGSENIFRGDLSPSKLISYIAYTRGKIYDKSIPVATSDTIQSFLDNPDLIGVSDVICATIYPFFNGLPVDSAVSSLKSAYESLESAKPIIISETGWASSGSPQGLAIASMDNAKKYFDEVFEWASEENVEVAFFSIVDEEWKTEGDAGDVGRNWGHFKSDGRLKGAYAQTYAKIARQPLSASPSEWAADEMLKADAAGLIPNYLKESFQSMITREEFADALALLAAKEGKTPKDAKSGIFSDTDNYNASILFQLGIASGVGDGTFAPDRTITRQEAARMLYTAAKALGADVESGNGVSFSDSRDISDWAKDAVAFVTEKKIMQGTGGNMFSPHGGYTREQSFLTIYRLYEALNQ
ncbi:MAG: S-layer homology domain-containing protein [Clostridiales bacterium]|nr:S-layer homology domain-containing protein [Clostridiales bacterium]